VAGGIEMNCGHAGYASTSRRMFEHKELIVCARVTVALKQALLHP
jgi:nitrite reductase/ring-hydroxylating ferredoxin subunit